MGEIQLDTLQNLILERYGFLIHYDEGDYLFRNDFG